MMCRIIMWKYKALTFLSFLIMAFPSFFLSLTYKIFLDFPTVLAFIAIQGSRVCEAKCFPLYKFHNFMCIENVELS